MLRRSLLMFIALITIIAPPLPAQDQVEELEKIIKTRQAELDNIQSELDQKKSNLQLLKSQEKEQVTRLYGIEEQLGLSNRLITKIRLQIDDMNRSLIDMEEQLSYNSIELERRQQILLDRLVWIYKRSRFSPLLTSFSAGDLLQAARRFYLFTLLNKYDRDMILDINSLSEQIEKDRVDLLVKKKEVASLQRQKERQGEEIKAARGELRLLLRETKSRKELEQKNIEQLSENQSRINDILETLIENRKILDTRAAEAFLNLKGKLIWPVAGSVIRQFGKIKDKKYNTIITNPGIDIKADAGSAVHAASSGSVAYISWLRGYGSFVILDHGGGYYSLYARLDEIFVEAEQFVAAGDNIATVSEFGAFGEPALHFELRYGREQLDPIPWLR